MPEFLKRRWPLFLVLLIFIICKIPHLFYSYYWDESSPYAPAVLQMYHHGLSLMPNAVDAGLSHGHPLFFHFIAALWIDIFGASHFAVHSFALFISVLLLVTIYEAGIRLFNPRTAVIAVLLFVTQEAFFVQSSFLLPEILVAFLSLLSLYTYVQGKYFFTAISLTMLFYTKESGLIMGFVLGVDALVGLLNRKTEWKVSLQKLACVGIPCILILVFFLLQKQVWGWYIFPMHSGYIETKWSSFWYNFRNNCLRNTFHEYMKYLHFRLLLILFLLAAIKNINVKYLAILLPTAFIYCLINQGRWFKILPDIPFFVLFVCSVIYFIYVLEKLKFFANVRQQKMVVLSVAFVLCYYCFSSMNYFTYRYLFAALVPVLFFTAVIMDKAISRTNSLLYYPVLLTILVIAWVAVNHNNLNSDCDLSAFNAMDVQQKEIIYLEQNDDYDKVIGCGGFLGREHLRDPATGFLRSEKYFKNVNWDFDHNTDLILFDNVERDYRYTGVKGDSFFHLVYHFESGKMWTEVYAREEVAPKK